MERDRLHGPARDADPFPSGDAPVPGRRRLLLAGATLPLLGACAGLGGMPTFPQAAGPSEAPAAPRVRVGDRWRYQEINRYNGLPLGELTCEVVEVSPQVRIRWSDGRGVRGDEVHAEPWKVIQEPAYDIPIIFERPMPQVPDPIAVGDRQRIDTTFRTEGGSDRLFWQMEMRPRGWERLKLPAGEFDALRVERWIWFRHPDYFRLDSHRWDHIWYAPAVDRWVRREWSGTYRWPGVRRGTPLREDWIVRELVAVQRAAG